MTNSSIFLNFHIKTLFSKNKQTNKQKHTHTQLTDSIYSKTKGEVIAMDAKLQVDRIFEKKIKKTCMAPLSVRGGKKKKLQGP